MIVIPIDESAPKGRLILPQQQTIRDILESGAISVVTKEDRVKETIRKSENTAKACDYRQSGV